MRRLRRNRRVFLSRTPSIRRVLMLKDVVADGLLGVARNGGTSTHQQMHYITVYQWYTTVDGYNVNPGLINPRLSIWGGTISVANYYFWGGPPQLINQGSIMRG